MTPYRSLTLALTAILSVLLAAGAAAGNTVNNHNNHTPSKYIGAGNGSHHRYDSTSRHAYQSPQHYSHTPSYSGYRSGNVQIYTGNIGHGYLGLSRPPQTWHNTRSPSVIYYNRHGSASYGYQQGYADGYRDAQHYRGRNSSGHHCVGSYCGK